MNKKVRNTCKSQLPATEIHLTVGTVEFELKLWTGENLALSRMIFQIQVLTPKDYKSGQTFQILIQELTLHVVEGIKYLSYW